MRLGLHALGIGAGANRAVIDAVAGAAERAGFATLWFGEHVIRVDRSESRYPYSDDGQIAIRPSTEWIDPMIGGVSPPPPPRRSASPPGCCCCPNTIRWWRCKA